MSSSQPAEPAQPARSTQAYMKQVLNDLFKSEPQREDESDNDYKERCIVHSNEVYRDALLQHDLAIASPAKYFNPITGDELIPPSDEYEHQEFFSINYEAFQPHFLTYIAGKALKGTEPNASNHSVDEMNTSMASASLQDNSNNPNLMDILEDMNAPENPFESKTQFVSNTCRVLIHHEAFQDLHYIDCTSLPLAEKDEDFMDSLPEKIHEYIVKRLEAGLHPILIWIAFDWEKVGRFRTDIGVQPWSQPWIDAAKTGYLTAVIDGDELTCERACTIARLLQAFEHSGSPLNQFFVPGPRCRVYKPEFIVKHIEESEEFKYSPRAFFNSLDELLTIHAFSIMSNHRREVGKCAEWSEHIYHLRLGEVANAEGQSYIGWLDLPEGVERPGAGTILEVTFKDQWNVPMEHSKKERECWIAKVSSANIGPHHMAQVTMSRPWDSRRKKHSDQKVHVVDNKRLTEQNILEAINRDSGNAVRVSAKAQTKVNEAQMSAIESIAKPPKNKPLTRFNNDILVAMVGSYIHTLEPRDLYEGIRDEFNGDITKLMVLNEHQRKVIDSMQTAPGGIELVHGLPGTGKSHLVCEMVKPFLASTGHHPVMIVASANMAVESLANKVEKVHKEVLQSQNECETQGPAKKGYVIRAYAPSAERQIREIVADLEGKGGISKKRPASSQAEIDESQLSEAVLAFSHAYLGEDAPMCPGKFAAIRDKRVRTPALSLAMKMLEVIGVIQGVDTFPDANRFTQLRNSIRRHSEGLVDNEKVFDEQMKDAMDFTLAGADAIITTTDHASLARIREVIERNCELLVVDDAPQEKEASLLPLFASRAPFRGVVLLGDWLQLRPIVVASPTENVFAKQELFSFMPRLISLGFKFNELTEQYRMNEHLCSKANALTYKDKLTTHVSATSQNQPKSALFAAWTYQWIEKYAFELMIDVRGQFNETKLRVASKYNHKFAIIAISVAHELLKLHSQATVAMITAYRAQCDCLTRAKAGLRLKHPELFAGDGTVTRDRLVAATVDAVQGEEFDYVIDTILMDNGGFGFQVDARRGNVATTRAKHGYVLIVDYRGAISHWKRSVSFVDRHLNLMKEYRVEWKVDEKTTCDFYTEWQPN